MDRNKLRADRCEYVGRTRQFSDNHRRSPWNWKVLPDVRVVWDSCKGTTKEVPNLHLRDDNQTDSKTPTRNEPTHQERGSETTGSDRGHPNN